VQLTQRAVDGDPEEVLAAVAAEEAAAVVVVGTRSHGLLEGVTLGSVPTALLHQDRVPVVVVDHRHADRHEVTTST
jgi:nucleotide-binding universal stress UspA family protein